MSKLLTETPTTSWRSNFWGRLIPFRSHFMIDQRESTFQPTMSSSIECPGVARPYHTVSGSHRIQEASRRHSQANKSFVCNDCNKAFKTEEAHQQHRQNSPAHTSKSVGKDCNRSLKTEEALQQHLRDSLTHTTDFSCVDCNKSFKSEEALQQHRKNSPVHATRFACTDCNKAFKTEEALKQHQRSSSAHTKSCDGTDNDRAFGNKQSRQQHGKSSIDSGSTWSMYPSLHDEVSRLLEAEDLTFGFCEADDPNNCIHEHDTTIMGRFTCKNRACSSRGWSSKSIAITIRMYPGKLYNAKVYKQRCQSCRHLGQQPILDDSYAERVACRLKKWCGIQMDLPHYSGRSDRPHQSALCEGCRSGHCIEQVYVRA
ncbi:zinc-binding domain-containing protein [Delphinella strobiligena]|nr:zinc-binding domain-containing protein [Delphinella strobiligena]